MKKLMFSLFIFLAISKLDAKIIYTDPVQDSKYVNLKNSIIIGFEDIIIQNQDLNKLIEVKGNLSGSHSGEIIITSDRKKIIFKPFQPFSYNETVFVKLQGLKTSLHSGNDLNYTFKTQTRKVDLAEIADYSDEPENTSASNFVNPFRYAPLPQLTVSVFNNPSPGNLYFNNYRSGIYEPNIIISDNNGNVQYSREMVSNAIDFKRQPNGLITYYTLGKHFAEDSQFNLVDSFYCGNGYTTDSHDLQILNNGHALVISYDPQPVDMSLIVPGGNPNAIVTGLILQEIDENKNVVFQWRSWDHFSILDAIHHDLTAANIDYVHGNAIEPDTDGNIMISSRSLSEITKINRSTGDIIWRFGGVNNQFNMINDTVAISFQHSIRRIPNGNIILFDNGNNHATHYSRAVEYQLDEVNKVATNVWQYVNSPVIFGAFRGSVQRLLNGNTLICWGAATPTFTEVTPAGDIALELSMPANVFSYRIFRDQVNLTLNLKLTVEGLYNTASNNLNKKDTVTAIIRNVNSPYNIIDSLKSVVDSVNFNGNYRFYNISAGTYYITVKYRNGIETWSRAGGESVNSGDVLNYDFTNSASSAFGNNLILKGNRYCIYSGDVNNDGSIDATDLSLIDNDVAVSNSGYILTDLNGDNFADGSDLSIVENNAAAGVIAILP